jgi:hypothetical protein
MRGAINFRTYLLATLLISTILSGCVNNPILVGGRLLFPIYEFSINGLPTDWTTKEPKPPGTIIAWQNSFNKATLSISGGRASSSKSVKTYAEEIKEAMKGLPEVMESKSLGINILAVTIEKDQEIITGGQIFYQIEFYLGGKTQKGLPFNAKKVFYLIRSDEFFYTLSLYSTLNDYDKNSLVIDNMVRGFRFKGEKPTEVQVPPERIRLKGFSLIPLNEHGWLISEQNPRQLLLGKAGLGKDLGESILIMASALQGTKPLRPDEDLIRIASEANVKNINPDRLRVIRNDVVAYPYKGAECAQSHVVMEDNAAASQVGKQGMMIQEAAGLICIHPKDKTLAVSLGCSHRYYPAQRDPMFLEKATRVLDSVEFDDP